MDNVAINKVRIVYYGLFSSFFAFSIDESDFKNIVDAVDILSTNPLDDQTEKSLKNIKRRLNKGGYDALKNESDKVFFSPTTIFVPMTASYYNEQRDGGNKRIEMMSYVLESKFRRNTDEYKEYEDHIEFVMLFIQKLINEELQGDLSAQMLSKKVFVNILNEMIDEFSNNLFNHEKSQLYKQIVLALRSFIDFERLYLNIAQPIKEEVKKRAKINVLEDDQQTRKCVKLNHNGWT
jgi:TorA maturation chaperone TorD